VDTFLALVVSGAVTGAIYSLVASGLTLSYAATGIFNFSYGAVAFTAAYLFYIFHTGLHWSVPVAAVVVILVFAPLLGILLDVAVFRPLARANESAKIMATVGLLLAIPALTEWITDGIIDVFHVNIPTSEEVLQVGFPAGLGPVPQKTWHIPPHIPITSNALVVLISAAVCAIALWFLLRRTPLGLQMRAVVDRHGLARTRGVNDVRTSRYAWVVGTVLAALAGVVAAPILGAISTSGYTTIMIVAAAAAVVGRLRSIPWAFVGGLGLGIIQNLVAGYIKVNISGIADSVPIVVLVLALLVLARDRSRRGGSTSDEVPPRDYLALLPLWRRAAPWTIATVFFICYVLFLANSFWAGTMVQGLALSLIFLSFVIVTGMGGMVSLAQATFATMAGLTTGLLFTQYHVPLFLAMAISLVGCAVLGLLVALPALRLGGLPLALATLALALIGDNVLFQWNWLDNNTTGWTLPRPVIGPVNLSSNRTMAITLLILAGLVMLLIRNLKAIGLGKRHRRRPLVGDGGGDLRGGTAADQAGPLRPLRRHRRTGRALLRHVPVQCVQHGDARHGQPAVAGHRGAVRHPPTGSRCVGRHRLGRHAGDHLLRLSLVVLGPDVVELERDPVDGDPTHPLRVGRSRSRSRPRRLPQPYLGAEPRPAYAARRAPGRGGGR
jgi:branched-subunit amino acid ABC-type transport system permease component